MLRFRAEVRARVELQEAVGVVIRRGSTPDGVGVPGRRVQVPARVDHEAARLPERPARGGWGRRLVLPEGRRFPVLRGLHDRTLVVAAVPVVAAETEVDVPAQERQGGPLEDRLAVGPGRVDGRRDGPFAALQVEAHQEVRGLLRRGVPDIRDRVDRARRRVDHRRAHDPDRRRDVPAGKFTRRDRRASARPPHDLTGAHVQRVHLIPHRRDVRQLVVDQRLAPDRSTQVRGLPSERWRDRRGRVRVDPGTRVIAMVGRPFVRRRRARRQDSENRGESRQAGGQRRRAGRAARAPRSPSRAHRRRIPERGPISTVRIEIRPRGS